MWRALPLVGVHNRRSRSATRPGGTAPRALPCGAWGGWGGRVLPGSRPADGEGMRASHVATALAALTAGITAGIAAATALHRRGDRRVPARTDTAAAPVTVTAPEPAAVTGPDAVVLEFPRPTVVPSRPAAPARCGDSGGVTRAGAPCAARATSNGRCHHHPVAA